jgi:hypothetical protein
MTLQERAELVLVGRGHGELSQLLMICRRTLLG